MANKKLIEPFPPHYGIKPGEPLKMTTGIKDHFDGKSPDKILAVKEYPYFILAEGFWKHYGRVTSYRFCINKASIRCKDAGVKRLNTGERLK